ncbi:MAG: hypothetical protein LC792_11625, partial [Actinobacteria bacterium]|nr:hypothetical protein [Actinomycetota bacterium]
MACQDCGDEAGARSWLGNVEICDRAFRSPGCGADGFPRLPAPPSPLILTGPDGRRHRVKSRIWP